MAREHVPGRKSGGSSVFTRGIAALGIAACATLAVGSVVLERRAPVFADFSTTPSFPVAGAAVLFTAVSASAVSWAWDFGDGGASAAQSPLHSYAAAGDYIATLSVRDSAGALSTVRRAVHVTEPEWVPSLLVPGIAHTNGAEGSYFRSSLWVVNAAAIGIRVRLTYRPMGGDGGHQGDGMRASKSHPVWQPSIERALAPGESLAFSDVVLEAFGASWDSNGTVEVEVPHGLPVPVVDARTYNDAGTAGTYGQYIPAMPLGGYPAVTSDFRIYGLEGDERARTNLGVVNLTDYTTDARATLFDAAGAQRGGTLEYLVPAFGSMQINRVNEAAGAGGLSLFGARVTAGHSGLTRYGSKLDARTSDPIFIGGSAAHEDQWIDGVAAAPGDLGTFFRTELVLASPERDTTVAIDFTPRGSTAPTGSATVQLAAGQTRLYRDVLGELFGVSEGAGSLRLRSTPAAVVAWARTYSDLGAAGTYGQFIPAFGPYQRLGPSGAILTGVTENARFRTNFGALNTSTAAETLRVEVWSREGSKLGERNYTIPAGGSLFEFRLLERMGLAPLADAYLRLVPSVYGALIAWTSTIDSTSSDPTFVPSHQLPLP